MSTSEAQGRHREARSEGSVEQSREPTNRNRIQGEVAQGERANDREAVAAKEPSCRSGGYAVKVTESYLGRSRLMSESTTVSRRAHRQRARCGYGRLSDGKSNRFTLVAAGGSVVYPSPPSSRAVHFRGGYARIDIELESYRARG